MGNTVSCFGVRTRLERKNSNKFSDHDELVGQKVVNAYKILAKQYSHYKIISIDVDDSLLLKKYKDTNSNPPTQTIYIYYNKISDRVDTIEVYP